MATRLSIASITILTLIVGACASPSTPPPAASMPTPGPAPTFVLTSDAFGHAGVIPKKFSCDGQNISPRLQWNGAPSNTQSFVLMMDDPDAPIGTFTHWVAFDIAATQNEIREGAPSIGKGGKNSAGRTGYTGPCPPSGTHRYFFTLYALDLATLGLNEGASRTEVEKAMSGHVLAQAQLMGKYSR